jgi:putative transposase
VRVKLTVKCKLDVPSSSLKAIDDTFSRYRKACEYISGVAHESRTFAKVSLHHRVYYLVRQRYGLPAQLACTARDKVAEAYRRDKTRRHQFKAECIRLDARTFRLIDGESCSFTTCVGGRVKASLIVGDYQRELLSTWKTTGAADLVRKRRNTLYVHIVVYEDFEDPRAAADYLGVDLGIRNIASTSDGEVMSGEVVEKVRTRYAKLRQRVQRKGTRSARRKLKRISGREQRFMRNTNHSISKSLVEKASSTDRGLAIEDLKGIRERTKVRKAQRVQHSSWAFAQLREFLSYKAAKASVHLAVVDPRNTSRTCNECGHCEKANRQGEISCCRSCGHSAISDINGARNIRAAVNLPNGLVANVACVDSSTHSYKPTALAVGS